MGGRPPPRDRQGTDKGPTRDRQGTDRDPQGTDKGPTYTPKGPTRDRQGADKGTDIRQEVPTEGPTSRCRYLVGTLSVPCLYLWSRDRHPGVGTLSVPCRYLVGTFGRMSVPLGTPSGKGADIRPKVPTLRPTSGKGTDIRPTVPTRGPTSARRYRQRQALEAKLWRLISGS